MNFSEERLPTFDFSTPDGAKEFEEYINRLLLPALKAHPKYPEYGYVWENGHFIEKKLDVT